MMEVWQARSLTTETASYTAPAKAAADPGLYCYGLKPPPEDGRPYYRPRAEHDPGSQPGSVPPQEAGQYDYPQTEAFAAFPGVVPPWYYHTTAGLASLPKRPSYQGAPRAAEAEAEGGGAGAAAAEGRTTAGAAPSSSAFVNGSWLGAPGPRRSRRRYQLWRESRQFLDSYYYDRRGRGAALPPRPAQQPPPPPLLPLLDLPEGGASGGAPKAPPPLLPMSEGTASQPPHQLYPPQGTETPRPPPHLLPMAGQSQVKVKTHLPRHLPTLPEAPQASLPRHSLLCQQHLTHPYHHLLHYHLQLPDPRHSARYPPPSCPHPPPQVSHASLHLPPLSAAEARDRHARAAYLRELYHSQ